MNTVRPLRSSSTRFVDDLASLLCLSLIGAALALGIAFGSGASIGLAQAATPVAGKPQATGTFTGEYVNGAPVYRLPTITVSASRK